MTMVALAALLAPELAKKIAEGAVTKSALGGLSWLGGCCQRALRRNLHRGRVDENHQLEKALVASLRETFEALQAAARCVAPSDQRAWLENLFARLLTPERLQRALELDRPPGAAGDPLVPVAEALALAGAKAPVEPMRLALAAAVRAELAQLRHHRDLAMAGMGVEPAWFAALLDEGWSLRGRQPDPITLGHVFALQFRARVRQSGELAQFLFADTLAELRSDLESRGTSPAEIEAALTRLEAAATNAEQARQEMAAALAAQLGDLPRLLDELEQRLGVPLNAIATQAERTAALLSGGFDRLRDELTGRLSEMEQGAKDRHGEDMRGHAETQELLRHLMAQLRQPRTEDSHAPLLDFPAALRALAASHGKPVEEVERVVRAWIEEVRAASTDLSERAKAEFLAQRFAESARLACEAGEAKLARIGKMEAEARALRRAAASDFEQAGCAHYAAQRAREALAPFSRALELTPRQEQARDWARLTVWLGLAHAYLGERAEGAAAQAHLREAVAAYRAALEVYTRAELPQNWASTQNSLGAALRMQGERAEGAAGVALLGEAVEAYRAALEVRTRTELPQAWAMTQNNLGNALLNQGERAEGATGVALLGEAVAAYRAALEVYTRTELPQAWAMTQNNLGTALWRQGERAVGATGNLMSRLKLCLWRQGERATGVALLREAVAAYRAALEVYKRTELPQAWAMTQHNLGNALWRQGEQTEGAAGVVLLEEAEAAYRAALEVHTRTELPQAWAMTQNTLGNVLWRQGERAEGATGVALLGEAVAAYRAALEVYTRDHFPYAHSGVRGNLKRAERELKKRT